MKLFWTLALAWGRAKVFHSSIDAAPAATPHLSFLTPPSFVTLMPTTPFIQPTNKGGT